MSFKKIIILSIVLLIIPLSIPACASNQDEAEPPPPEQAEEGEGLPPADYPKKGNPKLDSHLWQLIEAEKQGQAESLARTWGRGDDVVDGKVIVQIECLPGQGEAAAKVVGTLGAVKYIVKLKTRDLIEAVVPITSLEALANEESIRFIRLPVLAEKQ